ncbi:MAG: radical SAM protein, partial [Actinobacteria bacterium]|nr:radical SAM protein [Actinomycetota bacterium]
MDASERLRWDTVGDDPQRRLFGSDVERVTHPEFAGMEFLHVRAKSLINEVPGAAHLPFRYTINVYRGCSHACVFCVSGETPILMADGRAKPIADVRPGEEVFGTERRGRYRRYVTTEVLDHWETIKPAYRIALADGAELIASGDHRFLT